MKTSLHCRITQETLDKLRLSAIKKQKTMTQIISNFIDTLADNVKDKCLEIDKIVEK